MKPQVVLCFLFVMKLVDAFPFPLIALSLTVESGFTKTYVCTLYIYVLVNNEPTSAIYMVPFFSDQSIYGIFYYRVTTYLQVFR